MAGEELIHGDGALERQKTTKTSSEYRKTESESHEVERGGDYEKRVISSETRESSVTRNETVEIRRGAAPAFQPDSLPADWPTTLPDQIRLSVAGVQPEGCPDAARFDGDYILDLVDRQADGCRWEVQFDPHCRLYRASLTAHCGAGVSPAYCGAGVSPALSGPEAHTTIALRAALEGGVPGPRWLGLVPTTFEQNVVLHLDGSIVYGIAAGCRWPETVALMPIRAPVGQAFQPDATAARYNISPHATAAERAAMAAMASSSSSSGGCGSIDCTTDCHCVCPCPCCDGVAMTPNAAPLTSVPSQPMHIDGSSDNPVRYGNGEITLAHTDLSAAGFGDEFGHTRIFSNRQGGDINRGNGYNWLVRQLPHLEELGADSIMVVRGTRSTDWFDLVGGVYVGRFGTKNTLAHDIASGTFRFAVPNGQITTFNDFTSANPSLFNSQTTAGGQPIQVTSYAPGTKLGIGEVQRSHTDGGVTTIESFLYTYTGTHLAGVLWRRSTDGGATWTNIRQALYTYYGAGDANGSAGDLRSAAVQTWTGSVWQTIDNYYYRYWTYTGAGALLHCLKYVLGSAAYDRMTAAGLDPLTASDAQLAGYADLYLEYDFERHVTLEATDGGLYTFRFAYTTNANPSYFDDYNNWKTRTVETRPDGSNNTVYANFVQQVILKQLAGGADKWIEAVHFNSRADVAWYAHPSAVASFDDTHDDLAIVYRAATGMFHLYDYYADAAPGYVWREWVRQGTSGTPVLLKEYQYTQVTAGGATIYPTVGALAYRDDAGTQPLLTAFAYTFHPGTTAVQQRTTTWPVVPASQNGSGQAESRVEQFDLWGNEISLNNERGVVTQFTVDVATSGTTQRIDDATGMALVSDFALDNMGRTIQSLGPWHTIDLGGVATVVRTANWWVHQDAIHQVWTAQGYATGTAPNYAFTLVNPVSIAIMDAGGAVTDQIQAVRSSTSGPLLPTDSFAQSTYVRWTHNLISANAQLTATRVYYAIPASGDGAKGVNYNERTSGFDSIGRQNKRFPAAARSPAPSTIRATCRFPPGSARTTWAPPTPTQRAAARRATTWWPCKSINTTAARRAATGTKRSNECRWTAIPPTTV